MGLAFVLENGCRDIAGHFFPCSSQSSLTVSHTTWRRTYISNDVWISSNFCFLLQLKFAWCPMAAYTRHDGNGVAVLQASPVVNQHAEISGPYSSITAVPRQLCRRAHQHSWHTSRTRLAGLVACRYRNTEAKQRGRKEEKNNAKICLYSTGICWNFSSSRLCRRL